MSILSLSLKPMLAKSANKPFDSEDWIFEFKWDGIRAFYYKEGERWKIETRRGNVVTRKFPELKIDADGDFILDGEIFVLENRRPSFQRLQERISNEDPIRISYLSKRRPATFAIFDVVYLNGEWLNEKPLEERKEALRGIIEDRERYFVVPYVEKEGKALYRKARELGFEGIMAKLLGTPYIFGRRVDFWLKVKKKHTVDAVVCGITEGEGRRNPYFGSLVLGLYKDGKLVHIGNVGTGFSEEEMREILDLLLPYQVDKPPLEYDPEDIRRRTIWVAPRLVVEVEYQSLTEDGKLRMPRFVRIRQDKAPEECTWDQLS